MNNNTDEVDELNEREVVYPDGVSEDDFEQVEVKCLQCGHKRKFRKRKGKEYDYPMLMKCYECMADEGHVPVDD